MVECRLQQDSACGNDCVRLGAPDLNASWERPANGTETGGWRRGAKHEDAMDDTRFDTEQVFTPNHYYYFFPDDLLAERIEREVAVIWHILALRSGLDLL